MGGGWFGYPYSGLLLLLIGSYFSWNSPYFLPVDNMLNRKASVLLLDKVVMWTVELQLQSTAFKIFHK